MIATTFFLLLVLFFGKMWLVGRETDKLIEERRQGEAAAARLTSAEAKKIVLSELKICRGCFKDNPDRYLGRYLTSKELKRIKVSLGNVPLNLGRFCTLGEVLHQAVRYP